MLRGIYSSASGMITEMDKVAMHASNISNSQSAGFKRREMSAVPFKELMINVLQGQDAQKIGKRVRDTLMVPVGTGTATNFQELDNTQGSLKPTGNALDMALEGNGWLTMERSSDKVTYTTRNGSFLLNDKGEIVNATGDHLLDVNNKYIVIEPISRNTAGDRANNIGKSLSERISIKENGAIYDGGNEIARLKIQRDTDQMAYIPQLRLAVNTQVDAAQVPHGSTYAVVDAKGKEIKVRQGFVEESNVSIISEMVGLLHASKSYESGHKLVMAEDKILDKAINELGRTG